MSTCCSNLSRIALSVTILCGASVFAQNILTVAEPYKLVVKPGETPVYKLKAQIKEGYHANSDKPNEPYLIPLRLTWEPGVLEVVEIKYPTPTLEKYDFSEKPLSVVTGDIEISTKFKPTPNAALGPAFLTGKLRYQACNDKMCFPPKTAEVKLPVLLQ